MAQQITFTANQIIKGENSPMQNRHIIFGAILSRPCIFTGSASSRPGADGCYPNFTTAEGCNALNSLTTGAANTGVGWYSLFSNTDRQLQHRSRRWSAGLSTPADNNTAVGAGALLLNTTGTENTAVGANALVHNDRRLRQQRSRYKCAL